MLVAFLLVVLFLSSVHCAVENEGHGRRKNEFQDKSQWKKVYEDELTDAMLSTRKGGNHTRLVQSPGREENEMVIEKLMDTLTSSEKYLKKVDSIDYRLNRLDIEVHEKTNNIMKYLAEIMTLLKPHTSPVKIETLLDSMKADLVAIKYSVEKGTRSSGVIQGHDYTTDTSVEHRLSYIEGSLKSVATGVDAIINTISEVKNRDYTRHRPETTGGGGTNFDVLSLISEFRRLVEPKRSSGGCCSGGSNRFDRVQERYPSDCHEIQAQGFNVSGIYKIKPEDCETFYVLCDLTTDGGGWTVFQNRYDGAQDFYKSWLEYKNGFGNLAGEFWLGLEKVYHLTNQKLYELRVEVESQLGQEAYAVYSVFTLGAEHEGYRISTLGSFYGTAGDSLSYHAGSRFSTPDVDNDEWKDGACTAEHGGAWWYKECDKSNLNGRYVLNAEDETARGQSMYWISFKGPNFPLSKTRMMIRPLPASRPVSRDGEPRKLLERAKMDKGVKNKVRTENKPVYDKHGHAPYRYDAPHAEPFFTNYP